MNELRRIDKWLRAERCATRGLWLLIYLIVGMNIVSDIARWSNRFGFFVNMIVDTTVMILGIFALAVASVWLFQRFRSWFMEDVSGWVDEGASEWIVSDELMISIYEEIWRHSMVKCVNARREGDCDLANYAISQARIANSSIVRKRKQRGDYD